MFTIGMYCLIKDGTTTVHFAASGIISQNLVYILFYELIQMKSVTCDTLMVEDDGFQKYKQHLDLT